jgi:5'-nucleotidase
MLEKKPTILVTNDDSIDAKGIKALTQAVKSLGKVIVMAPEDPQSGMSHAITVKYPLAIKTIEESEDFSMYACNGTPVDCVKLAINQIIKGKPDIIVSGINHGSNSATSVLYSGTMGAALEGCINEIPSIGFSLCNYDPDANFDAAIQYAKQITADVLENGLPDKTCLNVNIPDTDISDIKGSMVCRQNPGYWQEEFEKRTDPRGKNYYWLTGVFHNTEPTATDTDEWALANNYVSIVPTQIDLTNHAAVKTLSYLNSEATISQIK